MSSEPIVRLTHLGKYYHIYDKPRDRLLQMLVRGRRQLFREFRALDDVNLDVFPGEVIGIIGKNGAGKSTLLQLICGTLTPTTGEVEVKGRVAALLELGAGFNPEFSGRENVYLSAIVSGMTRDEIDQRYADIVAFSGIGDFIDQPVKTYSSGMYVRLAFSVAINVDPDILVIDEALSVGDGEFSRKSFDRIMALKDAGKTILFCSHSMYHIEAICNRALWLDAGRVMMIDTPPKVTTAFNNAVLLAQDLPPDDKDDRATVGTNLAGQARIDQIVASSDGVVANRLHLRSRESDLSVQVFFTSDPAIPVPTVAFGLETISGISVSSAGSRYDGAVVLRQPDGTGMVELSFPAIPLMRGSYRMSIYLACERMIHIYDHALYCVELEVSHMGIEQGVVFLPHQWKSPPRQG
ncbi:MAG: ABC transporter ATP-binding protein [Desulfuromonadaceae bacterium]|nr:ABC transporter ATP-binding protein [Desulfuromonadaceae bacterium]